MISSEKKNYLTGFFYSFLIFFIYVLVTEGSINIAFGSIFLYFLFLISPLISVFTGVDKFIYTFSILFIFFIINKRFVHKFRQFWVALFLLIWLIYGAMCTVDLTGGP